MKIIYLRKADDDVISHCSCGDGRVTFPAQMECPWCGCGWLFSCMTCRKAFTFAEGVELETTWEQLAQEDLKNMGHKELHKGDLEDWIKAMKQILNSVKIGNRYVILDGSVFVADSKAIEFDGWYAHHRFDVLPQFAAFDGGNILKEKLNNWSYWETNALPNSQE